MEIKKYKFYSNNAGACCKGIFKSGRNFIRYYLFMILLIVSLPFNLLHSFVKMGYYRQLNKISNNEKNFRIADSYKDMSNHKRLFNVLLASIFSLIIKAGILFLIVFVAGILGLFAFSIDNMIDDKMIYLIAIIPAGIAIIVYLLYLIFIYIPTELVLEEKDDISYVFATKLSFTKTTFKEAKKIILSYILEYIIKIICIFVIVILFVLSLEENLRFLSLIGTLILVLYLLFIPKYSLKHQMVRYMVRRDIIIVNDYNELSSFNEKVFSTAIKNVNDLFKKDHKEKDTTKQSSIEVENRTEIKESEKNDIKKLIQELTEEDNLNTESIEDDGNVLDLKNPNEDKSEISIIAKENVVEENVLEENSLNKDETIETSKVEEED